MEQVSLMLMVEFFFFNSFFLFAPWLTCSPVLFYMEQVIQIKKVLKDMKRIGRNKFLKNIPT